MVNYLGKLNYFFTKITHHEFFENLGKIFW